MFCEISIIDLTTKRLLDTFQDEAPFEKARKRGYFGPLMKIVKIYSSIETRNEKIKSAITAKSTFWNELSRKILKPYEQCWKDELGTLENVPDTTPIEFTTKNHWD